MPVSNPIGDARDQRIGSLLGCWRFPCRPLIKKRNDLGLFSNGGNTAEAKNRGEKSLLNHPDEGQWVHVYSNRSLVKL
jgi:hypothetical protein